MGEIDDDGDDGDDDDDALVATFNRRRDDAAIHHADFTMHLGTPVRSSKVGRAAFFFRGKA